MASCICTTFKKSIKNYLVTDSSLPQQIYDILNKRVTKLNLCIVSDMIYFSSLGMISFAKYEKTH